MLRVNLLALGAALLGTALGLGQAPPAPTAPQAPQAAVVEPIGHSASVSRRTARLVVDLSDGSQVTVSFTGGAVTVNDDQVGTYLSGGPLERAWRAVLSKAGDLSTPELVFALRSLPAGPLGPEAAESMAAITSALPPVNRSALTGPPPDVGALANAVPVNLDSINEMARQISRDVAREMARQPFRDAPGSAFSLSRMATDVAGLFGTLVALASLGFGALFFVPQRLEVVADTVRRSPIRSFFAGLFAQPLLLPALVTLIIGLVLTIVGLLVVPVAIVAFVLAVGAALVGGYLAVARVVGEIYVRRRGNGTYTSGWATYRYLVYGLVGLLMIWAPVVLLRSIPVAGTILFITELVFTWAMATTGFGATILSKAGGGWAFGSPTSRPELSAEYLWSTPVPAQQAEARKGDA
ncbi:MAG: hypothetical protein HYW52_08730 [Gemmatimonadetes bacterium]|nr:hypothetical protein [Gemmatimonadota bacterium]